MQVRPKPILFLILASFLSLSLPFAHAEDSTEHEYEENARVARITLTRGEVSLLRVGAYEWEHARVNVPLVEGDTLSTGRDSRLEIQIDAYNFMRVGPDSVLKIESLRDDGIALSLKAGTLVARISNFDFGLEYFEIDAPNATVALQKVGLYRLDVDASESVRVTVHDDGIAHIYSENWGFVLRDRRSAKLRVEGYARGDWDLSQAPVSDDMDVWNAERERHLAKLLRYENRKRYYDEEIWGAEELDNYGTWIHTREYGYVWRPHSSVIASYDDWAPYRYGQWAWVTPYGWTWIPDEAWGWAPYHYGRWVYINGAWCWVPRGYPYGLARWRPALVAFVYIPTSYHEVLVWYPLTYGQRDPRSRRASRTERLAPLRANELSNLRRANPALLRAVTSVPARDFGTMTARARVAETDIARRALTNEPVRGRLPVTPNDVSRVSPTGGAGTGAERGTQSGSGTTRSRDGLNIVRSAPVRPPRPVPDSTTGAATRTPGLPLGYELHRRVRIYNEPVPAGINPRDPRDDGASGDSTFRVRPPRVVAPDARRTEAEGEGTSTRRVRPPNNVPTVRPPQDDGEISVPQVRRPDRNPTTAPPTRVRPIPSPDRETNSPTYTPPSPPAPRDAPGDEPAERPDPPRRVEPPARVERPSVNERQAPRDEPRYTPPEPRQPPPSAPPPRNDSPPPPPPRNDDPPLSRNDDPPPASVSPPSEPREAPPPPPREDPPSPRFERSSPPVSSERRKRPARHFGQSLST